MAHRSDAVGRLVWRSHPMRRHALAARADRVGASPGNFEVIGDPPAVAGRPGQRPGTGRSAPGKSLRSPGTRGRDKREEVARCEAARYEVVRYEAGRIRRRTARTRPRRARERRKSDGERRCLVYSARMSVGAARSSTANARAARDGEGAEWRRAVLETTLRWAVRAGVVIAILLVAILLPSGRVAGAEVVGMFGAYGAMVVLRYRSSLGYRARAAGLVVVLLLLASLGLLRFGLSPVPILSMALAVVSAGLLLGRFSIGATLAASTLLLLGVGALQSRGWLDETDFWLPYGLARWAQAAFEYSALAAMLAILVAHVVHRIETSLRQTERALQQSRREQREREEAEAALARTHEALVHAQKLQAVGRVAAGVGHDFNNTLQVVISLASLLEEEDDLQTIRAGLVELQQAAERGAELPRRLLSLGHKDAGPSVSLEPRLELARALRSLRRMLPEDTALVEELAETPLVSCGASDLEQIVLNLCINARDAMPAGGKLTAGCRTVPEPELPEAARPKEPLSERLWAELYVRDTGVGIEADVRAHLFEPFFTTKGEAGTGLGLATVHSIARGAGGAVVVDSVPGSGSCFHVFLPEASHAIASTPPPPPAVHAPRGASSAGRVVLLVEDEAPVREGMAHVLAEAGLQVWQQPDAIAARAFLAAHTGPIDLLCTDAVMPGGGTKELIDRFSERHPESSILICSGYVREELLRRDIDAGHFAFLAKPFTPKALVARVRALLEKQRTRATA